MEDASSFHSIDTDQDLQLILQLKAAGAKLPLSDGHLASELCTLIKSNQSVQQDPSCRKQVAQQLPSSVVLLRRYIAAGANISAVDYDNRAPLHIAAAEGDLTMVSWPPQGRCLTSAVMQIHSIIPTEVLLLRQTAAPAIQAPNRNQVQNGKYKLHNQ
eukprot:GHRR01037247.1.p1 GENE.GHRR01037247.1~~GHRR01037247.1.p1  ORF type:complete len:158 (+),score=20.76 GHRR01037247.1:538-1011(+)